MNLILLDESDRTDAGFFRLTGRRRDHLDSVLRARPGDVCKAGFLNGLRGRARVLALDAEQAILETELDETPPRPLGLKLVVALPRPKTFRKVLGAATQLGIKEIWFIQTFKVDKSYWQTPFLESAALEHELRLGLEQSGDTVMPRVAFRRRFKPFAEDELPGIAAGTRLLLAHPGAGTPYAPSGVAECVTLLLGPEGGFTPYEADLLARLGAETIQLGARILRTEVALAALTARLKLLEG